jgi:hypothetical protein
LQVLVRQEYRADRKERLGELVLRVADSFESAGVDQRIRASFSNSPLAEGVSAVARSGTFTLRRRTAGSVVVDLVLDVGTLSRMVTAVH